MFVRPFRLSLGTDHLIFWEGLEVGAGFFSKKKNYNSGYARKKNIWLQLYGKT